MDYFDWSYGIVPLELPGSRQPAPAPSQPPSYETPYWIDTINRAIERAAQVATIEAGGYPPYPQYPTPSPAPYPVPLPTPVGTVPQQGIQLSQTTLMLLVGGVLLFMLGGRRR